MVGLLQLRGQSITTSAVSWSVIGRFLHSSFWPYLLRADSAATVGVSKIVLSVHRLSALTATLVSVAAIVTPLGLYEAVSPARRPITSEPFHYIPDKSPMGLGTPPRGNNTWSRICSAGFYPVTCPNSPGNLTTTEYPNGTVLIQGDWYDSHIPQDVIDVFQSGLKTMSASVSSIFDIQWRFTTQQAVNDYHDTIPIDNGTAYTVSSFQQITSYILSDAIMPIEGLIVDMKSGGIGFLNHSAARWRPYGSTWTEDILFIVPETQCVDTNLTLDFRIPGKTSEGTPGEVSDLVLTDRGGFANFIPDYPEWDRGDTQDNPGLWFRAYKAAWLNNAYSMAFMNVTNIRNQSDPKSEPFTYIHSTIGKRFPLNRNGTTVPLLDLHPNSLKSSTSFGDYLQDTDKPVEGSNPSNDTLGLNVTTPYQPALYPNPFHISDADFLDARITCTGAGGLDYANITNIATTCGLLYGAPRRQDGSASVIFDPGSLWTIPLYSCISVTKATIKTVSFLFNGSDDLSALTVTDLADKVYLNDELKPLWGVENTELTLNGVSPLWGLIAPDMEKKLNISTVRKESLYLPGYVQGIGPSANGYQNLPGVDFPPDALAAAYDIGFSALGVEDYSGLTNLRLYSMWQNLSQNPTSAADILNLVWTDVAANSVLGTKSLETKVDRGPDTPPVIVYSKRIKYHILYGIPAFLALLLTVGALIAAVFIMFNHAQPSHIRTYLNETSVGRLLTSQFVISPEGTVRRYTDNSATKRQWVNFSGRQLMTLGTGEVVMLVGMTEDEKSLPEFPKVPGPPTIDSIGVTIS
ncbi:hypothetical protein TWF694_002178 [Orbilia ellipsospora]|uniref:Uncharacterized protein n=1 Tax=Orbilia ellipsospora TaxID=2528407 RepID=A0AAV9X5W6_9PEZI